MKQYFCNMGSHKTYKICLKLYETDKYPVIYQGRGWQYTTVRCLDEIKTDYI